MDEQIDVFNLGEESKKLNAEQKRARQRHIDDARKILKTPEGRRYFWRKLGEYGIFHISFTLNSNQTAFNEGMRDAGLRMLNEINEAEPSVFAQMQNEYLSALKAKKENENA